MNNGTANHWQQLARHWEQVGHPLRPCREDLEAFRRAADEFMQRCGMPPRVLLLGVTPELYSLGWPRGTDFLAADRSDAMIENVWPGPRESVVRGEWLALQLATGSRDLALCDGGLHLLDFPRGQQRLAELLSEFLAPGGRFVVRLFVPPAVREESGSVLEDFAAGHVRDLNILKLRLAMAMMPEAAEGVALHSVWESIHAVDADRAHIAARIGWTEEHLGSIDAYRGSKARYHFASTEEARMTFEHAGFRMVRVEVPTYELGERCPVVTFERI